MSDEERDQETPEEKAGDFSYGVNQQGDLVIDGTVVEKGPYGHNAPDSSQAPSSADPDELAVIRRRNAELESQFERAEPFLRLADKPVLREILNEYIERGEVEPNLPPPPSSRDVLEYNLRKDDPDFPVIRDMITEWALTLPPHEYDVLNNNHAAFVREYDRLKSEGRLPKNRPPVLPASGPNVPMDRRTLETILRSKEVRNARVEPPGGIVPDYAASDPAKEFRSQKARHARAYQSGIQMDRDREDVKLVEAYFSTPKSKRSGHGIDGY